MNTNIEFHDSTVAEIVHRDGKVIVDFRKAYVHKSEGRPGFDPGTGWVQDARLIFAEASFSGVLPDFPCDLMGGELVTGGKRHDNLIPVPLEVTTPIECRLVCDSIHTVTIVGQGVWLELFGEPRYVEEFKP